MGIQESIMQKWGTFIREHSTFTSVYEKAFRLVPKLVLETTPSESDQAGFVILELMLASLPDFDDIMTLSSHDAHWGALKLLRCLFERVVTLKYLAQNPQEAKAFVEFDALDWKSILEGIDDKWGLRMSEQSQKNLDEAAAKARKTFKQEPCRECGLRKRTTWTPYSAHELAKRTGLGYMFLHAYVMPSKFIHATYFGTQSIPRENTPMVNTIKNTHALLAETITTHQRYFNGTHFESERMLEVVSDFLQVWKYAESDFGLGITT
jgi:uncharacterized protein DUF5677